METEGTGTSKTSYQLEALTSTDDQLFLVKGGILLGTVATAEMLAGFVTALSLAKKKSPEWSSKGSRPQKPYWRAGVPLPCEPCMAWGSIYSWHGFGVISFEVWKALGIHITMKQMKDFQSKMQSIFPTIPKNS
ncbi:transmembrane protein 242-like [Hippopotamus amphibius kiboko]|uniref:transmembrane protein 242-like n=1 Tax=Hippopotamus amphibius kiboko TaxID=575201 RepID=UPI002592D98D|nr:transmembrane protein 242-like [Hippopotamus amphibius kiboko]